MLSRRLKLLGALFVCLKLFGDTHCRTLSGIRAGVDVVTDQLVYGRHRRAVKPRKWHPDLFASSCVSGDETYGSFAAEELDQRGP